MSDVFFPHLLSLPHSFPLRPPLSRPTATSMLWSSSSPRHRRSGERRAASSHCTRPALAPLWPSPRRPEVRRRPDPTGSGRRHLDTVTPAVVFVQIRRPSPWKISIANVVVKIGSPPPSFQLPLPGRRRRLPNRPAVSSSLHYLHQQPRPGSGAFVVLARTTASR